MSKSILKSALAGALLFASPAMAATFVTAGDSANIVFDGTQPGTSANLLLTLTNEDNVNNIFTFSYTFQNTSDVTVNPTARVTGFGFNDNTNLSVSGTATGLFDTVTFGNNFPNGLKNREICVHVGNCLGGNEGVTAAMGPMMGSLILNYTGSGLNQITLDNFAVRYISTGINGQGSGTGIQNAVPEPSTWMLMLLGMAGVGFTMRRKDKQTLRVRYT